MSFHIKIRFGVFYWSAAFIYSTVLIAAQFCTSYLVGWALVKSVVYTYSICFLCAYVIWKLYKLLKNQINQ